MININIKAPFIIYTPRAIETQEVIIGVAPVVDVNLEMGALTFKHLQQSV